MEYKILVFTPFYPPYQGGASTFFSNLITSLSDEYNFFVITSYHRDRPIIATEGKATIYRVIPRFESLHSIFRLPLEAMPALIFGIFVLLFKRIQLIHSHSTSYATLGISLTALLSRCPIIYDCQDESFPPRLVKTGNTPLWFSCAPNIDDILVNSGVPRSKIVRIPVSNPPYIGDYKEKKSNDYTKFRIIFVGSIRELKGISILLKSFRELVTEYDAHLVIVGEGKKETDVQEFIEETCLSGDTELTGRLSHRDTLLQISSADVLVLPSRSEGLPRVILEALQLGTPVITTDVGSITEVVTDRYNGLIIEPSPKALHSALREMYENPEFRRTLTENAKESNERNWEKAVQQVSSSYRRVLEST